MLLIMMTSEQSTGLMSISGSGLDQGTESDIADHQGSSLPGYLAYLSLGFILVAATVTILLASQVIATISKLQEACTNLTTSSLLT